MSNIVALVGKFKLIDGVITGCKPLRLEPWADVTIGNDLLSKEFFWPGCKPQAAMYVLEMTLIFSIRAN